MGRPDLDLDLLIIEHHNIDNDRLHPIQESRTRLRPAPPAGGGPDVSTPDWAQLALSCSNPMHHAVPIGILPQTKNLLPVHLPRDTPLQPCNVSTRRTVYNEADTAKDDEIRESYAWGVLAGVTTNPSLIAKEGKNFIEVVHQIFTVQGPVSAEVVAQDAEGMIMKAFSVHLHRREGAAQPGPRPRCLRRRHQSQRHVVLPGVTSPSRWIGGCDHQPLRRTRRRHQLVGNELIENIVDIYGQSESIKTQVLAASIRHPMHLMDAALAGAAWRPVHTRSSKPRSSTCSPTAATNAS